MAKSNSIEERIRKLLNMADCASSPEEAAIAAGRASKLLSQHNLDRASVMLQDFTEDNLTESSAKAGWKRIPDWVSALVVPVAQLHDCEARYGRHHKSGNSVEFLGETDDVMVAKNVFDFLLHQVWSLGDAYRINEMGEKVTRKERVDFRSGASRAVIATIQQLQAEKAEAEREESSGAGQQLVVLKSDLIKQKYNVSYSQSKSATRMSSSYSEGKTQGSNISITSGGVK